MYGNVTSMFRSDGTLNLPMSDATPVIACSPVFGAGEAPAPPKLYKPVLKNSGAPGVVDPTHRAALVNITPLWHCAHLSRSLRNSASPRWAASDSAPVLQIGRASW